MNSLNKKLLIDVTCLFDQYGYRGIGRYAKEVLKRLIPMVIDEKDWEIGLIGFYDLAKNLIDLGFTPFSIDEISPKIEFFSLGSPKVSGIRNIFRWKQYDEIIFEFEPSIYFAPHFERGLPSTPYLKHSFPNVKTAVTVHDVIPLVTNKFSQYGTLSNLLKKQFYQFLWQGVKKADVVFTSSDFSKLDLIKYGRVDESKIKRVYLGIDEKFFNISPTQEVIDSTMKRFGLDSHKYFFYDSGLEGNKGISNLLLTLFSFWKENPKSSIRHFVVTGSDLTQGVGANINANSENGKTFLKKCKELGIIDHICATGRIEDNDLLTILSQAKVYIYFSDYEGFGFGPLQAMAAKVPSIVNSSSCLPEIVKNGSVLVDAKDVTKTVQQISKLLKIKNERDSLIKKGYKIAKSYNWEDTVSSTWGKIKEIVVG